MCVYDVVYVSVQLVKVCLVPATVALFAVAPHYWGVVPLFLLILLRIPECNVCSRSGCALGAQPKTKRAFVACVRRGLQPVGSGWSFYLKRDVPSKIFYTRRFRGRKNEWWKSGTSIQEVADYYRLRHNKAFPSLPSISTITLGAWIWTESHGSSGDTGAPSNACFKDIEYVALDKRIRVVPYALFDIKQALAVVCVSFDVEKMADNFFLHKRKIKYDALAVQEWLRPSYQRAIFIGKYAVFLQWSKEKRVQGEEHEDPHCCSRFCLWLQSDPCNAACGCCLESEEKYASRVPLYEVNQFVPSVWQWTLPVLFGYGHRNYEIFCALPKRVDVTVFFEKMVAALLQIHKNIGGRSEIRFSKHVVFLDLSLTADFDRPFRLLESLGVQAYTLHRGKFEPNVASSMRKMSNKELYTYAKKAKSKNIEF